MNLALIQPGSGKSVNCRGQFSFDLAFTRCKFISPGIWQMCNRALWFWESAQNSAAILLYLERVRNWPNWEPASPRTLHGPGPEIDWNVLLTPHPHCGLWPRGTSPMLGWSVMTVKPVGSGKVDRVVPRQNFWWKNVKMDIKMSFLTSCQKFKKICKTFL